MSDKDSLVQVMDAMAQGRVKPLFDLMSDDIVWRWMGVERWTQSFHGKENIRQVLFGGATDVMAPGSRVEVRHVHADRQHVIVEHQGHNELPEGRRYDNNYCWVCRFDAGLIVEVREYMDTQLVTDTFGSEGHGAT